MVDRNEISASAANGTNKKKRRFIKGLKIMGMGVLRSRGVAALRANRTTIA